MRNLPKQLQNGLVMWLDSNGKDLSGNWNNWTLVNAPTKVRRLQNDGLSYNGTSQYTTFPQTVNWNSTLTFSVWIWQATANGALFWKFASAEWDMLCRLDFTNKTLTWDYKNSSFVWSSLTTSIQSFDTSKYFLATFVRESDGTRKIYINSVLKASGWAWTTQNTLSSTVNFHRTWAPGPEYLPWKTISPMLWNRALSAKEVEALYYATYIK